MHKPIVTHTALDLDAITGVWLLKRYRRGLDNASIEFVNTGNPDPDLLAKADAVVDTGKILDPDNLRFDHHQLPGDESTGTCAALQVWEYLMSKDISVEHLKPLAMLVYAGDNALKIHGAGSSQEVGLHALLSGFKGTNKYATDDQVFEWMCNLLDIIDIRLKSLTEAKAELDEKMVYQSNDGKVVALKHASTAVSFAAYEVGAVLVAFEGEPIVDTNGEIISYPIGISRNPEATEPHIGELVKSIITMSRVTERMRLVQDELKLFFNHNAGFFSGKGTAKAPFPHPSLCELAELAEWIDHAWER